MTADVTISTSTEYEYYPDSKIPTIKFLVWKPFKIYNSINQMQISWVLRNHFHVESL